MNEITERLSQSQERLNYIDMLKGFLTILVVIGHIIVRFSENPYNSMVFEFCYSFHMFLYIFISGYLISEKKHNIQWIKKRFLRLFVPYYVWSTIFFLLYFHPYSVKSYLEILFFHPLVWFLIVLFLCDIILFISESTKKTFLFLLIFIVVLNILYALHFFNDIDTLKMLAIYLPFYGLGIFLRQKKIQVNKGLTILLIVLYVLSMFFYSFKDHSQQIELIDKYLHINKPGLLNSFFTLYNHYIVAPLGCFTFWTLFVYLSKNHFLDTIFSFIGKYSLQIYILENIFFIQIFENYYLNFVSVFLLAMVGSIVVSVIISKIRILNKILFGL